MRSLRFRLSWTNSVVLALAVLCVGWLRYATVSYRVHQRFDEDLRRDAAEFSSRMSVGPRSFSLATDGLSPSDAFGFEAMEAYCVVTDLKGRVLFPQQHSHNVQQMLRTGALDGVLPQTGGISEAEAPDGTAFRFASLHSKSGSTEYLVHVGRHADPMRDVLREYRLIYLTSLPLILGISAAVGWYLAGRALKPFEEVARTAEQITSRSLNTQITSRDEGQEVQRLVNAFNSMVGRLHSSFRQMQTFNADVAHELRTPLAMLQGETEIALQSPDVPDEIRAVLCSNLEELERLGRIVNDMLTLAQADAGAQVLSMRQVDLAILMTDLVEQMRLLAADRGIQIATEGAGPAPIIADELWIRRALLNLLDNAIKYSKDGGRIRVGIKCTASFTQVQVRDEGIGIGPEDLPHIFDRMYRSDPARSRSTGGTGLGLALVKWVVEAHKGTIRVDSRRDQGSTFTVDFPRASPAAQSVSGSSR